MITANRLIIKVAELVFRNPDYVYKSVDSSGRCLYVARGNTPACIFGQAFAELGISLDDISEGTSISQVCRILGIETDPDQSSWMIYMQHRQDVGYSWGTCLIHANTHKPEVLKKALINLGK